MHSREDIIKEIKQTLKKYLWKKVLVNDNTKLFHDLFLYGDDAGDFFEEISEYYGLTEPEFDFGDYFPGEGEAPFWFERLISKKVLQKWKPMTVDDLADILIGALSKKGAK